RHVKRGIRIFNELTPGKAIALTSQITYAIDISIGVRNIQRKGTEWSIHGDTRQPGEIARVHVLQAGVTCEGVIQAIISSGVTEAWLIAQAIVVEFTHANIPATIAWAKHLADG